MRDQRKRKTERTTSLTLTYSFQTSSIVPTDAKGSRQRQFEINAMSGALRICASGVGDDHTLTMTMAITTTTTKAITTTMTMATTTTKKLHQDFSKMILCDFRVSFVSQINWQPIGKLLFMINLHASRAECIAVMIHSKKSF